MTINRLSLFIVFIASILLDSLFNVPVCKVCNQLLAADLLLRGNHFVFLFGWHLLLLSNLQIKAIFYNWAKHVCSSSPKL